MDGFQIGKGVRQGCILSPCLFNLNAEYIMRNAGLEEAQAGIKIAGRNINNLRYADDTTLMAESEEELKSLQYRLQRNVNRELPDVQAGFRKGNLIFQRSNCQHPLDHRESKRIPEKHLLH